MVDSARHAAKLEFVLEEFEPPAWPIHLVRSGQRPAPAKLHAFIDWVAPRLKARITGHT